MTLVSEEVGQLLCSKRDTAKASSSFVRPDPLPNCKVWHVRQSTKSLNNCPNIMQQTIRHCGVTG